MFVSPILVTAGATCSAGTCTTGTIFALYKYDENGNITNGRNIVMSGYCLYGGCTQYVMAYNNFVSMYQYNTIDHSFSQIHDNMKMID